MLSHRDRSTRRRRRVDMKGRFSKKQIMALFKEADAGVPVKDLCQRHGCSVTNYYLWRSTFGGMTAAEIKRLKVLEAETVKLRKLLAETVFERDVIRELLKKKS